MTENALVFVHGLNNGPAERAQMLGKLHQQVAKWGLTELFPEVFTAVAQWRSLGSWALDLADMAVHPQRRAEAAQDVAKVVDLMRWRVASLDQEPVGKVVVVSHSMGQVHTKEGLQLLPQHEALDHVEVVHVSLGGPLGNMSPVFRSYLAWALDPPRGGVWHDVWNPDDPVCSDPMLTVTTGRGYAKPFEGIQAHKLVFAGKPTPLDPLREHSSYFESDFVAKVIRGVVA